MKPRPTKEEITQFFANGGNCCQCTLARFSEKTGYDVDETNRIARCFGGGMMMGEVCGGVTGGLMAIGLTVEDPAKAHELGEQFEEAFRAKFGTTLCRDLLGVDVGTDEGYAEASESSKLLDFCPIPVLGAMEILEQMLEDY